ncbi:MAG: ABC transporter permease subunit [Verrucomicrobia bacterium]|nr:ABC transporter permease subunit [Verrucomicrobiota bacterium]
MQAVRNILVIFKREIKSYFESPVAYVFMIVFLVLTGFLTFSVSQFYENKTADLQQFFFWHAWVYLLLVPAATMSLWAEERRSGTIELLFTMPVTMMQTIVAKFLAAWLFIVLGLAFTFPIVITTEFLGNPDMGIIFCGYFGSALMAGAYVAIGMLMSSTTRSQVIGFVLALLTCLALLLAGFPPVTNMFSKWAPTWVVDLIAAFGFTTYFDSMQRGVIDIRDVGYYLSVMIFTIFATHLVLDSRKSA